MNYLITLSLIVLVAHAKSADLPKNFQLCDRHSPEFLKCISDSVTDAIISLGPGLKSFKILPVEPLAVDAVTIGENGGPVAIQQNYKNVKVHGLTKGFRAEYDSVDLDKLVFLSTSMNKQVDFVADYSMSGRILLLPIRGNGAANITMLGLTSRNKMECEKFEKDGETYLRVTKYTIKFTPKKVMLNFTNLFDGDVALSNQMNKFLNENADLVFRETQAAYEETFGLVFTRIANEIFKRVPFKKIFGQ